ncbi:hypothetical protein JRQ81_014243, partial [Phrynocephalus forsythii]
DFWTVVACGLSSQNRTSARRMLACPLHFAAARPPLEQMKTGQAPPGPTSQAQAVAKRPRAAPRRAAQQVACTEGDEGGEDVMAAAALLEYASTICSSSISS